MLDRIALHLAQGSEQPAFFVDSCRHSYGALAGRVATIQALIDERCSTNNQIIAVVDNADLDTYATVLAILFSGHGYLPLNPKHPIDRSVAILKQTDVELLLCSDIGRFGELIQALPQVKLVQTAGLATRSEEPQFRSVPDTNHAYLLFTSGSTGQPKGVPINRHNLSTFLEGLLTILDLRPEDRVLQMFDLTFDFSVMSLFAPLVVGACVYPAAAGELRSMSVYRLLEEQEITCAPMVPSVLTFLRPYLDDIRLDKLRVSVFCGEPLLADMAAAWSSSSPRMRILNFYGPTEATVFCSHYEWTRDRQKSVNGALSIGRPMPNVRMLVVDEHDAMLPANQQGELCLAGAQITAGYWRDAQKDAEAFFELVVDAGRTRLYRTGDLAYVDDEGDFMYLGRLDQQVKVQGFRIELTEIEHSVRESTGLRDVVAVTVANKAGLVEIVLCLGGFKGDTRSVLESLRARLPPYMIPSRIALFPELPLNNNGKIDRPMLRGWVTTS